MLRFNFGFAASKVQKSFQLGKYWTAYLCYFLSLIDLFSPFDHPKLMRLSIFYASDFNHGECISLEQKLNIYSDNALRANRFTHLKDHRLLFRISVKTRKHMSFILVYTLLKLNLISHVATVTVKRWFSAIKIGDQFLNDYLICFFRKLYLKKSEMKL